jgi:LacI family transcriptional regulator
MRNITIKDVAKEAGVSIATVSRVLNNNYFVSDELKAKVNETIGKLNYYPNSIARSLKNESTLTIGLIVSDISNAFFTTLARSVEDIIRHQNYNLIVCSTDNQKEKEYAYLQLLMEKKVDGIILNTTGENCDFIASISHNIPIALCGRKVNDLSFRGDFVDSDNITGSYELTRHMIKMGHKKIGIINGQQKVSSGHERMEGFCKAMLTIGVTVDESYPYIFNGDFNRIESGYQGAHFLLNQSNPPTAIVIMNNEMAIGTLSYCKEHQVQIPEDVSIGCYGDIVNADLLYVQPSNVTMSPWTIGKRLAELIIERIESDEEVPNREIRFSTQLNIGNGVKKI